MPSVTSTTETKLETKLIGRGKTSDPQTDPLTHQWYKTRHILRLNFSIFWRTLWTSVANGYLCGSLNVVVNSQEWKYDFNSPGVLEVNVLATAMGLGVLAGFILFKCCMADLFSKTDKNYGIITGNVIVIIGALLQAGSTDSWVFGISRLICGFGIYLADTSASVLSGELALPEHKDIIGILYGGFWFLGVILGNAITHRSANEGNSSLVWKLPSAYQAVLPALQLVLMSIRRLRPSAKQMLQIGDISSCRRYIRYRHFSNLESDGECESFVELQLAELAVEKENSNSPTGTLQLKELINSSATIWVVSSAVVVPFLCIHFGNGIVLNFTAEVLEKVYGLDALFQQIVINSALLCHNLSMAVIKGFWSPSIPQHKLAFTGLILTALLTLTFVLIHGIWSMGALAYDKLLMNISFMVLRACANITIMGIPATLVTSSSPSYCSDKISAVMGVATNVALLYNGYINPWSMPYEAWVEYMLMCLACFGHFVLLSTFAFLYRNRTLYSL